MSDAVDPARNDADRVEEGEGVRVKERLLTALTRGATAGCVLRGGLTVFVSLLALYSRKKRTSERHPLGEIVRVTLFLGSLGGTYVMVDEAVAALWGKKRTSSWRGFLAGVCAGPSLLFLGRNVRHNSLALYILIRSLTLIIRCGNHLDRRHLLFTLLSPTRMKYGDVALMCVAGAQILYSYVMMPHTMGRSYKHFLDRHTGREAYVWHSLKEMVLDERCQRGEAVDRLSSLNGTGHVPFFSAIPCPLLHPNKSCAENVVSVFPEAYVRALSVYLPVYLAPAILVHRKKIVTEARVVLPKVLAGILRSSLFLSSFVTLAFTGACAVHNIAGMTNSWTLIASLLVPGVAILTEKKSRRMELGLYATSRAAEAFVQCLVDRGYLGQVNTRIDVVLFSLSVGIIMHCYSDDEGGHRHAFRSPIIF